MHTAINYFANTHHEGSKIDINPRMTMWLVLFLKSTIDIILLFEVIYRKDFSKPSNNTHITCIKIKHDPNENIWSWPNATYCCLYWCNNINNKNIEKRKMDQRFKCTSSRSFSVTELHKFFFSHQNKTWYMISYSKYKCISDDMFQKILYISIKTAKDLPHIRHPAIA